MLVLLLIALAGNDRGIALVIFDIVVTYAVLTLMAVKFLYQVVIGNVLGFGSLIF